MYITSEKLRYYAKNKPYMTGLNKLLPLPFCYNRWTDEQKTILSNIKKIEEQLNERNDTIGETEFIENIKSSFKDSGVSCGIRYQLVDSETKEDEKGYIHTYNVYKYILKIISEEKDIVDSKEILTLVKIDEPTPYLSGSIKKLKLCDLLKNEEFLKTIQTYPQIADKLEEKINCKEKKREL